MTEPAERPAHKRIDARALRALAHPLRVQIMELLWLDGPATATRLAQRLGESSGTLSWHLRQLADQDLIAEDPDRGTKRERWWRFKPGGFNFEPAEFMDNPDLRGPIAVYLHAQIQVLANRLANFLAEDWGPDWYTASAAWDWRLRLRTSELAALNEELRAVVDRYKAEHDPNAEPRGDGEETVVVQLQSFPRKTPPAE